MSIAAATALAAGSEAATVAASSIPTISYLAAAGSALSAVSAISQGIAGEKSAKYNAQVAENNALIAKQNATFAGEEGAQNAAISSQKTRAEVGGIKAAQAANGIDVNKGSAVDVRSSASELGELNAITIRSNAARQAYGFQTQEASDKSQSALDKSQAGYALESGIANAGTTLLTGGTKAYESGLWNNYLQNSGMGGA